MVQDWLAPHELEGELLTDGPLQPGEIGLELAEAIRHAGPWGQGFPEPLFDNVFQVQGSRVVGERHLKLILSLPQAGPPVDAIAFRALDQGWEQVPSRLRLVYRLDVNHWRGSRRPQLVVEHMQAADGSD